MNYGKLLDQARRTTIRINDAAFAAFWTNDVTRQAKAVRITAKAARREARRHFMKQNAV
mgnify:CR=1